MATLEQIAEAIKRADAAGNVEDVKTLGAAYRQMQAQATQTQAQPATTDPGFNPYDTGATKLGGGPGVQPAQPVSPLDATLATVNGISASVPFLQNTTDAIGGTISQLMGGNYGDYVQHQKDVREGYAQRAPLARIAGEVGGTMGGLGLVGSTKLGAEALGMTGSLGTQLINGGLSSAGLSTADALSSGKSGIEALKSSGIGLLGGLAGTAAGKAVNGVGNAVSDAVTRTAQRKLTNEAIKLAPDAAGLKAASSEMFKAVDEAGVTVAPPKFAEFVSGLVQDAKKMRIDPQLDVKAVPAYQTLVNAVKEVQDGAALTVSDLHTLRQIAQKAATSTEGRDAMFANKIVDGIDRFVTSPGSVVNPGGQAGGNELLKAISTWGRARRVSVIEEAVYKAQNQASGMENGLRTQFRQILQNPNKRKLFSKAEIAAIEDVVRGNSVSNVMKLIGKFGFGSGGSGLGGFLGGTAGLTFGGPIGAAGAAIGGSMARKLSEKMTEGAANRAARVIATPNIPVARQMPNLLAGAEGPLSLLLKSAGIASAN